MTCPPDDDLLAAALGEAPVPHHITDCLACARRLAEWRAQLEALGAAVAPGGAGHAAGRRRLLEALPAAVPSTLWQRGLRMAKRNWLGGAVAATLAVGLGVAWLGVEAPSAFAQAGAAMKKAPGLTCDVVTLKPGDNGREKRELAGKVFWRPDGATRFEAFGPNAGELTETSIRFKGKTGIDLRHASKEWRRKPAEKDDDELVRLLTGVADFRGKADKDLSSEDVAGVNAKGFTVATKRLLDEAPGTLHVWLDPATSLPVRIDLRDFTLGEPDVIRFESFAWKAVDDAQFDVTPPKGYTQAKDKGPTDDVITGYVTTAFRVWAKYHDGRFPQVKNVYGDQHANELRMAIGLPKDARGPIVPDSGATFDDPKEEEYAYGSYGLSWVNTLQRRNEECVYNGKTVTMKDPGKTLFRWKLDDGRHRVIFGDLTSKTLTGDEVKALK